MLFVLIPSLWLTVATAVVAMCRMAARADALPARAADARGAETPAHSRGEAHSPRRPTTCGTVRRRIFTSVHSDQFATYR